MWPRIPSENVALMLYALCFALRFVTKTEILPIIIGFIGHMPTNDIMK